MLKVYLSSTYVDLVTYREAVRLILDRLGHQIIHMEAYSSADERPMDKCLDDVKSCDVYIGIVAWRYGFVPPEKNPDRKSMTQLEYEQAGSSNRPRLMFLLDPHLAWPPDSMDTYTGKGNSGQGIREFRESLSTKHLVSFFTSPEDLAAKVSASIQGLAARADNSVRLDVSFLDWVVRSIPIAPTLLAQLELARAAYQAANIRFVTSSLLLTLLRLRDRFTFDRINEARAGLAPEIESILDNYISTVLPQAAPGFADFDWVDRPDVIRAQFYAFTESSPLVREKHILLAILEGDAQAIRDLREYIGNDVFSRLIETTRKAPSVKAAEPSPRLKFPSSAV